MTSNATKLLVTGGTGVLGPPLVEALGLSRCILLRHRTPVADPAIETITGDLGQPRLALDAADYKHLLERIDGIVHAGALTSSLRPSKDLDAVNIDGTRHVIELAEQAQVPLHHVSTFYVRQRDQAQARPIVDGYQSTKRDAEALVEQAAVPTTIYRLPILIGDTQTGAIPRFTGQAVYLGAKAIVVGNAHALPATEESYLDFLPRDYVAQCLSAAIQGGVRGLCWITAGQQAITFGEFVEMCVDVAGDLGRPIVKPKLFPPEVVERFVLPAFGDTLPRVMRRQLEIANQVMLALANETQLPDSRDELPSGVEFPPLPDLRESLRASLRYWSANTKLPKPIEVPDTVTS
jgi:nucleoside-diphosphate-sugar epimerase